MAKSPKSPKAPKPKPQQLSARVKKLAKDFALIDGKMQMSLEKMHEWMVELGKVAEAEREKLAQELVALAIRYEREGQELASMATAQLYTFAASVMRFSGELKEAPKTKPPPKP